MNTVAPSAVAVNATRAPEFVAAILEADVTPYMLGVLDAEKGEMACPEMYYTKQGDICAYCEGHAEVAGPTLTTAFFLTAPAQPKMVDYDAELADLQEGMADAEWHSRGQW